LSLSEITLRCYDNKTKKIFAMRVVDGVVFAKVRAIRSDKKRNRIFVREYHPDKTRSYFKS